MGSNHKEASKHLKSIEESFKHVKAGLESSLRLSELTKEAIRKEKGISEEDEKKILETEEATKQAFEKLKELRDKYGDITGK